MFINMNFKRLLVALTALFLLIGNSTVSAQVFVPVFQGSGEVTETLFNEGQFKGVVSIGNPCPECADCTSIGCVRMVKADIRANGRSPYSSRNDLDMGPVWPDQGSNFQYTLPVQIPCERDADGFCTEQKIPKQNYTVSCTVYYSNNNDSYLSFKNQSADASYWTVTPLNFTMNPGYIKGTVSINGETLSGGYVYASSADINTRIRIGSDGKFCFPVQPSSNITLYADVTTADGVNFRMENETIASIASGQVINKDLSVNPGCIRGTVTVLNPALTLTGGYVYAGNAYAPLKVSGSAGTFEFPVSAGNDIGVSVNNITANTGNRYQLESKSVSVTEGNCVTVNWEFNPVSAVKGDFVLNCLGSNTVDRHWAVVSGDSGRKEATLSGNGSFSLDYLLPGTYGFYANTYLNGGDDYLHLPYRYYINSLNVPATGVITNNVNCNAAFIDGQINFGGLSVVDVQDAVWANIYGYGVNANAGGESWDKIDVDSGDYDLVVSEGNWRAYLTEFKFEDTAIILEEGDDPVYLNSYLYINDHARQTDPSKIISLNGCGDTHKEDFDFQTGAVTFIYNVKPGDMLQSTWLKGGTKERAMGWVSDISDDSKGTKTMGIWNADSKSGEATMIGTPGWYNITAGGVLNGIDVSFGAQGEFMANKRSTKRDDKNSELGVEVRAGEHKKIYVDLYPPTLKVTGPSAVCRSLLNDNITVSGTATDDVGGIASITVNGEAADFSPTNNPDDEHEVSFTVKTALDIDTDTITTVVKDRFGKTASDTRYVYTAGVFTVGESGLVIADYLYDGGMYEGELGIFSLSGMENLEPNSGLFAEEAARRALSNSSNGYVILSDAEERARLSGQLGSGGEKHDWNDGVYRGLRRFRMRPGDKFATIMIPNDTIKAFFENQHTDDPEKQPLFSLASSNPDFGLYFGQIANIDNLGSAFVYEDQRLNTSDWDYNDFIVRITGITACSPTLDNSDISLSYDWRNMELGSALVEHISVSPPDKNTMWMTVTLKSPAHLFVYDPQGRVIGKDGAYIPGATFEIDENGHQIVSLPQLESGKYRIVLQAIGDGGLCHLEVKGYKGESAVSSQEKPFEIGPGQVFSTAVSADSFTENMTVIFDTPKDYPQDFDKNGMVDDRDIEHISSKWNLSCGDPGYDASYDMDNDCNITILDIMRVVNSKDE